MSYTSEELDAMADRGELKPAPGTAVYRDPGAPALTDKDLMGIFAGRPREEERRPANVELRVKVTPAMKEALKYIAQEENLHNSSALVRSVLADFIQERAGKGRRLADSR
ncbi:hypothetical protein [Bifidobacterium sp. ESL0820]|uniref:hypothetical protein n=1 Tax=Bifidobacterium sp. ESL0820 TaxID=3448586 RepID=UPI004042F2F0